MSRFWPGRLEACKYVQALEEELGLAGRPSSSRLAIRYRVLEEAV